MTPSNIHAYYMAICDERAKSCKCHSRHIGALIVKDEIVIPGYNGPPRDVPHCETRKVKLSKGKDPCLRRRMGFGSGEGMEHCIAAHAELNAILNAARQGICTTGTTLYLNETAPCPKCMVAIIQAGIVTVVYDSNKPLYAQRELTDWLALHGGVELVPFKRQEEYVKLTTLVKDALDKGFVPFEPPKDIRFKRSGGVIEASVPPSKKAKHCSKCGNFLSDSTEVAMKPYATVMVHGQTLHYCSEKCFEVALVYMKEGTDIKTCDIICTYCDTLMMAHGTPIEVKHAIHFCSEKCHSNYVQDYC